ncbi:TIGR00153 family protein [bacterium]|nr:TIGR00153 family protein [bacterium]
MNILSKLIGGASPFDQLGDHLEKVMECLEYALPLLNTALDGDFEKVKELSKEVFTLEHEADKIKLAIRDSLPKAKLLPVSRPDLLAYLKQQDNIADNVEDMAMMLTVRPMQLPEKPCDQNVSEFKKEFIALAEEAVAAAKEAARMFERLNELKNAAFSGKITEELREIADKVGKHEHEADKHQFRLVRCILSIQDANWDFASSYTLLAVIQALGKLANSAESMTDYIRLMVAE